MIDRFPRLRPRRPLDRTQAHACAVANLLLPGSGSLFAGRVSGWFQALLALGGFALTLLFAAGFVRAWIQLGKLPTTVVIETGRLPEELKLPFWLGLCGIALFFMALLWAACTSLLIVMEVDRRIREEKDSR